jgi:hypothetical protein
MSVRTSWYAAALAAVLLPGAAARAGETTWKPAAPAPADDGPVVTLGAPVRPDGSSPPAPAAAETHQASYLDADGAPPAFTPYVARGEPPDAVPPPAGGAPVVPPPPGGGFNTGVCTDQPLRPGFWDKCKELFHCGGERASATGRCAFQSDHCFDVLASPVTNPFLFEDPRALTELRPVFIYQGAPHRNPDFSGGYSGFFGTQARLAFTERWSLVVSELGFVFLHPHSSAAGITNSTSFAQVTLGPKWTFYRCPDTNTVAAAGLDFEIPTGDRKAFQDTGTLSLVPYLTGAQAIRLPQGYGSIDLMGTTGYSFSVDSKRSEFYYLSTHVDYNVANLNLVYPFLELNWFHYTAGGKGPALGFEGADLVNFGSSNVGGRDFVTLGPGVRYKFGGRDNVQMGLAVEFPLTNQKELTNYRVTFDVIFRY